MRRGSLWRELVTEMGDWLLTGRLIKCVTYLRKIRGGCSLLEKTVTNMEKKKVRMS